MSFSIETTGSTEHVVLSAWRKEGVLAAFSTRHGGVSAGPFEGLNLSFSSGDEPDAVRENRRRWFRALGVDPGRVVAQSQVHGVQFTDATRSEAGRGIDLGTTPIPDTDGLATATEGLFLMGIFADCVPVFFFSPTPRAVALVHSGWRGTASGIAPLMARHLQDAYGADPNTLRAAVGPGIGPCHYEVGPEVKDAMRTRYAFSDRFFSGRMLDLKGLIAASLVESGLKEAHVCVSDLCTYCQPERFYSHRRQGLPAGRMAGIIGLEREGIIPSDGESSLR